MSDGMPHESLQKLFHAYEMFKVVSSMHTRTARRAGDPPLNPQQRAEYDQWFRMYESSEELVHAALKCFMEDMEGRMR